MYLWDCISTGGRPLCARACVSAGARTCSLLSLKQRHVLQRVVNSPQHAPTSLWHQYILTLHAFRTDQTRRGKPFNGFDIQSLLDRQEKRNYFAWWIAPSCLSLAVSRQSSPIIILRITHLPRKVASAWAGGYGWGHPCMFCVVTNSTARQVSPFSVAEVAFTTGLSTIGVVSMLVPACTRRTHTHSCTHTSTFA